jgi:ABC-type polysaccharide/polyol phosphate transport system ATPase subunit
MSSEIALRVENLGKCYHIYEQPHDRLKQILWRGRRRFYKEFWALRDVSLEVRHGETLGIVGRNGSGKSTLLQLICGTLTPTTGSFETNGRIGALLELGAGFNPEFTGRENVYLNAAIMGLSQAQIDRRYAAIAAFADIGDFLEQPVKTYSSGMYVRLAFAVAIHIDPEILIIDEVLSVGDMLFQLKCFLKFQELQDSGKTILFVSHDPNAVKRYCSRAVLLEAGRVHFAGSPNDTINRYTRILFPEGGPVVPKAVTPSPAPDQEVLPTSEHEYRYGSGEGEIHTIMLRNAQGCATLVFTSGERMTASFRATAKGIIETPILAMTIKDQKGQEVYVTNTHYQGIAVGRMVPGDEVEIAFAQELRLIPNTYFVSLGFVYLDGDTVVPMDRRYDVVEIKVLPRGRDFSTGIADLQSEIQVRRLGAGKTNGEQGSTVRDDAAA